jgi:PTH1 family peptidyl-tRNA hydrolase
VSEGDESGSPVALAKPQTFMNRSGPAVAALLGRWKLGLEAALVVHDDLDLPFGAIRIRVGGGHGGHNGVRSIVESLGGDFTRLKIGIGRPVLREEVVTHVLSPFDSEQASELPATLDRAADAVQAILAEGPLVAMNRFHA